MIFTPRMKACSVLVAATVSSLWLSTHMSGEGDEHTYELLILGTVMLVTTLIIIFNYEQRLHKRHHCSRCGLSWRDDA